MTTAIQVNDLHYTYEGQDGGETHIVFDGLSLSIEQGSFVAVLGHNGCGKSTLAKHFNAILLPAGGSVTVYGMDTKDEEMLLAIRQHVGMVFQNPDNQIVSNVVEEDVAFAPENLGVASQEIRQRVDDALRAVGMYDYRTYAPQLLSGGQKQRVAIAGVLAMQPQCVVLDEPTAMLDPQGRREVLDTIERLNRETGMTVILITHHMDEAARADRVIAMSEGRIVADGTPQAVFAQEPLLRSVGLDVPQTEQLLLELKRRSVDIPTDALTDGLESLLSPLKRLHAPVHELSMMMSIALRFIPTLIEETDKIMSAQKARGADFESGNLLSRAKALVPILVPLFISAFRRADELATAMECRCYHGGEGRTKLSELHYQKRDYLAYLSGAALLAVMIVLRQLGL